MHNGLHLRLDITFICQLSMILTTPTNLGDIVCPIICVQITDCDMEFMYTS